MRLRDSKIGPRGFHKIISALTQLFLDVIPVVWRFIAVPLKIASYLPAEINSVAMLIQQFQICSYCIWRSDNGYGVVICQALAICGMPAVIYLINLRRPARVGGNCIVAIILGFPHYTFLSYKLGIKLLPIVSQELCRRSLIIGLVRQNYTQKCHRCGDYRCNRSYDCGKPCSGKTFH